MTHLNRAFRGPGDQASEEAIYEYLPLVRRVARRVSQRFDCHGERSEMLGAGFEGLLEGLQELPHVDPSRSKSFLRSRIYGAMLRVLRQVDHLSRSERRAISHLLRSQRTLESRLGRAVDSAELAAALGVPKEQIERLKAHVVEEIAFNPLSVPSPKEIVRAADDAGVDHVSHGGTVAEIIDDDGRDPLALLLSAENTLLVEQALDRLPDREYEAVVATFYDGSTLREVGDQMGVTEARASQLRTSALRRMKKFLRRFQ